MGRSRIHVKPPKQVKIYSDDAYRILALQGRLSLKLGREVSKADVVSSGLDALEQKYPITEEAHVTG